MHDPDSMMNKKRLEWVEILIVIYEESARGADQISDEIDKTQLLGTHDVGYYRGKRDAYRTAAKQLKQAIKNV